MQDYSIRNMIDVVVECHCRHCSHPELFKSEFCPTPCSSLTRPHLTCHFEAAFPVKPLPVDFPPQAVFFG